ncbi:hypothetical protein [Pseudonocardia sp. HH130630-07]|uniref:hypothetical protein n=1 Tax=Pseudonocardia sp. HH130630-07 TaxID=1690815 RepID=UPI000814DF5B|nr:hypothetical protein [Pseudonocardia sp. HH130630-07]ANY08127.1 hypothetical protein AFB00_19600 [Pseudonocardia sp. HH130630-07]
MTRLADRPTVPLRAGTRTGAALGVAGVAGLCAGVAGGAAAEHETLRVLGHLVSPYVLLVALLVAGTGARAAAGRGVVALAGAVAAFYLTRAVVGASGLRVGQLGLWLVLAVLAGIVLGLLLRWVGRHGPASVAATAGVVALVLGDVLREERRFGLDPALLTFAALAIVAILLRSRLTGRGLLVLLLVLVPITGIAHALIGVPDQIERILF